MTLLTAFLSGLVFGLGLIVSGMANPAKVLGFLDLAGAWDPSLALVMVGAIGVGVFAFRVAHQRMETMLGVEMKLPKFTHIDKRLVLGSVLFGAGWGIGGFCPGPGIVAMGAGETKALLFVISMIAGMVLFEWLEKRAAVARAAAATEPGAP
jgi:uncharacterized membrane protein YedE/YeeE